METKDKIELLKLAYKILCDENFHIYHYMNGKLEARSPKRDGIDLSTIFSELKRIINEDNTKG